MKKLVRFPLWLILLLHSGCALVQPTDPIAPVPGFKAYGSVPPPAEPPPPVKQVEVQSPLTLERCLEVALANNPEVAAGNWEVSASQAKVDQARAARWPSLTYEANYLRYMDHRPLREARYNGERRIFSLHLTRGDVILKLPLFTGGRILNEIKAAELVRLAEQNRLSRTKDELVFNVSSTFYSILAQEKVIDSLKFSLQAMQEQRRKMAQMVEVAKAAKVDLLRTEVRLADLEQSLAKEENVLDLQKRLLANLLGLDSEASTLKVSGSLGYEKLSLDVEDLLAKALRRRPDFNAARERLAAQARKVDVARAAHWPAINLVGSYGYRGTAFAQVMDDRNPKHPTRRGPIYEDDGNIGVTLSLPLFEGGRLNAKVREELATLAAAQERLRKLNLQIRQEVESAVLDISSSSERIKALEKSLEAAKESLRVETLKYNLSAGTITDVLDAQAALLATETSYYRALADFRTALARLKLAVGGDLS